MSDEETVYLGVPAVHWMWTQSARSLMVIDLPRGSGLDIEEGSALPALSRNWIIERYLETDHEWLMLVDSDMRLPRETFRRLASWGVPAVWALAFGRVPPYVPIAERYGEPMVETVASGEDGLVEAHRAGAGCILLRREVLEAVGRPWFKSEKGDGAREDAFFCDRVREEGYGVMVDFGMCAKHVGATPVDKDFATAYWQRQANRKRAGVE